MHFETESTHSLSMEDMVQYPLYYRRMGVRMPMQLVMPTMSAMADLELPMSSVLHYIADDESLYGIPQDEPILRNIERLIMVEHITALADTRGNPLPIKINPGPLAKQYHRKYRRTRPLQNFQASAGNPRTLIVENYALLPHLNRYLNNYFKPFNKWWNIQATVWHRMGEIASISNRQQFMQCKLPAVLPTLQQLRKAEAGLTRQTLEPFKSTESLFILELWKWFGKKRSESVISKCPDSAMDNVNLIFTESDRWIVFNMGKLNSWIKTEENPNGSVDREAFQRRFLRMLMILMDARTGAVVDTVAKDTTPAANAEEGTVNLSEPAADAKEKAKAELPPTSPVEPPSDKPIIAKVKTDSGRSKQVELLKGTTKDILPDDGEFLDVDSAALDRRIEEDLAELATMYEMFEKAVEEGRVREIASIQDSNPDLVPHVEYSEIPKTLEQGVIDKVNELADGGLMSAGEYRRFMTFADAYKKLPDPYGSDKTLAEAMVIKPEELIIKNEEVDNRPKIADNPMVVDKSMLGDSLRDFDTRYASEILPRDILNAVMNLQRAGIAVTDYQVETIEDALNYQEQHSIQLTPVQGKASTIRFMVPKVRPDGTFIAGGVKCRMRKQRGDEKSTTL